MPRKPAAISQPIATLIADAFDARRNLLDARHESALRLFNGFYEGEPGLVVDVYAGTLVVFNYADPPEAGQRVVQTAIDFYLTRLPWIHAVIVKRRHSASLEERHGALVHGSKPDRRLREHGIWYAIDLTLSQDASFYLDTRLLRQWALHNLAGKSVLNSFAYTGSLGVAAQAGGARQVVHLDLSRKSLNLAKESYTLNGFPIQKADFQAGDFWVQTSRMRRAHRRFDCVILDPPFFSLTSKGRVDLVTDSARLINKVRPLVEPGGRLVAINNAVFVSGAEYLRTLESLCEESYLEIETLLPVPEDVTGFAGTIRRLPPVDPAPFNHSTKIAILGVK